MAERIKTMGFNVPKARVINSTERKADISFYTSAPWRKLRAAQLSKQPLCDVCYVDGVRTEAKHVDHIRPRKSFPDLALSPDNLCSLCVSCHSRKTAEENREKKKESIYKMSADNFRHHTILAWGRQK